MLPPSGTGPEPGARRLSVVNADLLDVVLLLAVALFAVSGYRQGLLVGLLCFVGFLGGGLLGAQLAPTIATRYLTSLTPALVGLVAVFVLATLGQVLAAAVGAALRGRITWRRRPAGGQRRRGRGERRVGAAGGLAGRHRRRRAPRSAPWPARSGDSAVLGAVDSVDPDRRPGTWFSSFRRLIDDSEFPQVFGGLATPATVAGGAPRPRRGRLRRP